MIKILELTDLKCLVGIAKNDGMRKPWVLRLGKNVVIAGDVTNYINDEGIKIDYIFNGEPDRVSLGSEINE